MELDACFKFKKTINKLIREEINKYFIFESLGESEEIKQIAPKIIDYIFKIYLNIKDTEWIKYNNSVNECYKEIEIYPELFNLSISFF